ncbi:MAG: hypothetical protein ACUVUR_04205 [bacterium]
MLHFALLLSVLNHEIEFGELKRNRIDADVVIVPCFGGWGNVPLEQAQDLTPILGAIQAYLDSNGLRSVVAPYRRAPADFPSAPSFGVQLAVITEMLGFHKTRAYRFAVELETLIARSPRVKWLLIGISNGADFVDKTMEVISLPAFNRVVAIEIGVPFWRHVCNYDNILYLDNGGTDPLVTGELEIVFFSVFKGLLNFLSRGFNGDRCSFERIWHIPSHDYSWTNIMPAVIAFFDQQLFRRTRSAHH